MRKWLCPLCGKMEVVVRRFTKESARTARCNACGTYWPYLVLQRRGGQGELLGSDGQRAYSLGVLNYEEERLVDKTRAEERKKRKEQRKAKEDGDGDVGG